MSDYASSDAVAGQVLVADYNGNITVVPRDRIPELMRVCVEALAQQEGCRCGPGRVEVVAHENDETFWPRRGCTTCNTWDGPPRLKNP